MMKEKYQELELEIIAFQPDDVITTSGDPNLDPFEGGGVQG